MTAREAHRRLVIAFDEDFPPSTITKFGAWNSIYKMSTNIVISVWSTKGETETSVFWQLLLKGMEGKKVVGFRARQ